MGDGDAGLPHRQRASPRLAADHAADLIERFIGWEQRQFQQMGQGAALLTSSLRDPQIMTGQAQHIKDWIDSLT